MDDATDATYTAALLSSVSHESACTRMKMTNHALELVETTRKGLGLERGCDSWRRGRRRRQNTLANIVIRASLSAFCDIWLPFYARHFSSMTTVLSQVVAVSRWNISIRCASRFSRVSHILTSVSNPVVALLAVD